jgi:hypothetical protein
MSEPGFLKNATHQEQYGDQMTPMQLFADPTGRRFPYHTKAACWRSAQALSQHLDGEEYADLIKAAATVHGIDAEVASVLQPGSQIIKYAYTVTEPDGAVSNYMPLRNSVEVLEASAYLGQYRDEIHLCDRQKIAAAIVAAANEYGTEIENDTRHALLQQAGLGECRTASLKQALLARATLLGVLPEAASLQKLGSNTHTRGSRESRQKIAVLLDQIDREFGLTKHYATGLRTPENALFEFTQCSLKKAEVAEVMLKTGSVYSKVALEKVNRRAVQDWLGDTFADSVYSLVGEAEVDHHKMAQAVALFPIEQARRFEQCAASCGITPLS